MVHTALHDLQLTTRVLRGAGRGQVGARATHGDAEEGRHGIAQLTLVGREQREILEREVVVAVVPGSEEDQGAIVDARVGAPLVLDHDGPLEVHVKAAGGPRVLREGGRCENEQDESERESARNGGHENPSCLIGCRPEASSAPHNRL